AVDPVLALEIGRAGKDTLFVEHDRVDDLGSRRARRVPRRCAEQLDDLAPALGGPLDHLLDLVLRDELGERGSADRRRRDDRNHLVAVAAEHHGGHVLHRRLRLPRDKGREPRGVEDARHPEDPLLRPAADVPGDVAHRIERVRDDDQDRVGRLSDRLLGHGTDDLLVRRHQVVTAHAGRARQPGGDDDDVSAGRLVVAVRADDVRFVAEHGTHLIDVECLALRETFLDVDEHDVRVVARGENLGAGRADVPGADDCDLPALAHTRAPILSMIASATSLVPTAVGSSRAGFMSYVTLAPSRITSPIAASRLSAASDSSRWRSISIPESIIAIGLTLFCPAYFGAEPWVGSKIATSSPKFAPGAMPSPP